MQRAWNEKNSINLNNVFRNIILTLPCIISIFSSLRDIYYGRKINIWMKKLLGTNFIVVSLRFNYIHSYCKSSKKLFFIHKLYFVNVYIHHYYFLIAIICNIFKNSIYIQLQITFILLSYNYN
jgi:hypothetical protein